MRRYIDYLSQSESDAHQITAYLTLSLAGGFILMASMALFITPYGWLDWEGGLRVIGAGLPVYLAHIVGFVVWGRGE